MGDRPKDEEHHHAPSQHFKLLQRIIGSSKVASDSLIYSYHRSFNGFAARLTHTQMHKLSGEKGIVSVFPSSIRKLHTTRSWDFLGLPKNATRCTQHRSIIVGVLDTGIWPESQSFNDSGYIPPPKNWKGTCQSSSNFTCNNKIIGARYYHEGGDLGPTDIPSPRDTEGHGTHVASTAAGNFVTSASLYGLAYGTARGGVPCARIAIYKICWSFGCSDADILKAFDDAIADNVTIINLSVGSTYPLNYFEDSIALGSFHSMKNGILTCNSAGNSGPYPQTITNVSPWSFSIAASTIDRKFTTNVMIGNGKIYNGSSLNTFEPRRNMYPLIYGGDAPNKTAGYDGSISRYCYPGTLDKDLVRRKIVYCDVASYGEGPLEAGAAGAIMGNFDYGEVSFPTFLPVSRLNASNGNDIFKYYNSTSNPTAVINKTVNYTDSSPSHVAYFSSRGPNPITSDILKPDVIAPGVNILAAWSKGTTLTGLPGDARRVSYNIISGTSMSCPHATGAASYVKSFHPTWSPAAIKSALMTTAHPLSARDNLDAEFAYGSGQINPIAATNPGLVYDANDADYVKFLCGQGYTSRQLRLVTGDKSNCSQANNITVWDLNYPSFALSLNSSGKSMTQTFQRRVTNVGPCAKGKYKARVKVAGVKVHVEPKSLSFKRVGEVKSFNLTMNVVVGNYSIISGTLVWSDGVHTVRSPIVIFPSQ
ncbi:unnamed protein product [Linum perenne]